MLAGTKRGERIKMPLCEEKGGPRLITKAMNTGMPITATILGMAKAFNRVSNRWRLDEI